MIFQDRELLRHRREESHQTVDDDHFYSKAAFTLCFFLDFTRRGSLRCCEKAAEFRLCKHTAGRMSRQMAETAVSCHGRPASPRPGAPASRKGCHEAPAQAPGGRGCGTGTMAFAQGSCGRQTLGGPGRGTLQRDCLPSTAAPAPDLLARRSRASPGLSPGNSATTSLCFTSRLFLLPGFRSLATAWGL